VNVEDEENNLHGSGPPEGQRSVNPSLFQTTTLSRSDASLVPGASAG
jgi:hypothetical protein